MSAPITNHSEQAVARLIEQFKDKARLTAVITGLVDPMQDIEDMLAFLRDNRMYSATGVALDRLGDIVGQPRAGGQTDADYLIRIQTRVIQNVSRGEPERLILVYKILMGATLVLLSEHFPAAYSLASEIDFVDQEQVNEIIRQIDLVAPAAVRLEFLSTFDLAEPFAFAGDNPAKGFGTVSDGLVGGKFAHLHQKIIPFAFAGVNPNYGGFGTVADPLIGGSF